MKNLLLFVLMFVGLCVESKPPLHFKVMNIETPCKIYRFNMYSVEYDLNKTYSIGYSYVGVFNTIGVRIKF